MRKESELSARPAQEAWRPRAEVQALREPQPGKVVADRSVLLAGLAFAGIGVLSGVIALWQRFLWQGEYIPGNAVLGILRYVSPMSLSLAIACGFVARRSRVAVSLACFTVAVLALPAALDFLQLPDIPHRVLQPAYAAVTLLGGAWLMRKAKSRSVV